MSILLRKLQALGFNESTESKPPSARLIICNHCQKVDVSQLILFLIKEFFFFGSGKSLQHLKMDFLRSKVAGSAGSLTFY